jgi:hypothetical protein
MISDRTKVLVTPVRLVVRIAIALDEAAASGNFKMIYFASVGDAYL